MIDGIINITVAKLEIAIKFDFKNIQLIFELALIDFFWGGGVGGGLIRY